MGERAIKKDDNQVEVTLSIQNDIGNDLQEIASFDGVTIENLAYSYIVEGIAGDSRILKRAKLKRNVGENRKNKDFHAKSAQEIVNDFNFHYLFKGGP